MTLISLTRAWLTRSVKPFTFTGECDEVLNYTRIEQLGLYVHIPFCRSICSFCPYCKEVYTKERARLYQSALLKEIALVTAGAEKKQVTSLYFGGGTPALLTELLGEIIERIQEHFTITEGIGVELHPEDVTEETLRKLKEVGVTKISIGIQSFQPELMRSLGREPVDSSQIHRALQAVRFETVSMDFIFALPGQTAEALQDDIDMAFACGADQIAMYPFIDFTFADNACKPMAEKEKKKLLETVTAYLERKGCVRNSIWVFGKAGKEKYSSMTRDNFLGFGCSAATLLADQFKINTFSVDGYIDRINTGKLPTSLTLRFTMRQRMVYYLFWTAYTMTVDEAAFEHFFGKSLNRMYGAELFLSRLLGWAKKENGRYVLTSRGAYRYHYFEQFYTLSYIDSMWNVCRNKAFPERLELG